MGFGKIDELLVVLIIILVLFGGKKIPELARSLGSSVREVRKGFTDDPAEPEPKKVAKSSTRSSSKDKE